MSLEEILHTFNSPPSMMATVGPLDIVISHSRAIENWLRERGHLWGYGVISVEAKLVLDNPKNLKTLESYLAF
jgi:hypothetical protein